MAYVSDDSGTAEIYVQPFAPPLTQGASLGGPKTLVSKGGGTVPRWRADGKELFYRESDGTVMSVAVTAGAAFQTGVPQPLFQTPAAGYWVDAAGDGNRFLVAVREEETAPQPFTIVLNWQAALKK